VQKDSTKVCKLGRKLDTKLGYNATVVSIPIFYSLFFCVYNYAKTMIDERCNIRGFKNHLLASIVSGGICDFITNPLWVCYTKLEFLADQD
jgi:solute carrier family 25 folate transporter 32